MVWPGVMHKSLLVKFQFQAGVYLADMAKRGNWQKVLHELDPDNHLVDVKQWRPGGKSWLTVLHQAAWNGAPLDVVSLLIDRGALRSQPDAQGRTAYDIAAQHDQSADLLELLTPPPAPLDRARVDALNANLAATIDDLIQQLFRGEDLRKLFRYPPVEVLHEVPGQELWLPVPYLWGGFRVSLQPNHLELLGGYREQSPSGDVHVATAGYVITDDGSAQVYEGYE